jgi:HEAT repeat protein
LKQVLAKVDDQAALKSVVLPMAGALQARDVKRRRCAAHALHENVGKIKDKAVLVRMVRPLTVASLQVKDSEAEGMSAGDLAYSALKQVLDKVDDQAALKSIILPMAQALKAKDVKRRRYAAHAVMLFAHKVKDKPALGPLVQPLVAAHFHDPDERVRQSAGMALKRTFGQIPEPK